MNFLPDDYEIDNKFKDVILFMKKFKIQHLIDRLIEDVIPNIDQKCHSVIDECISVLKDNNTLIQPLPSVIDDYCNTETFVTYKKEKRDYMFFYIWI